MGLTIGPLHVRRSIMIEVQPGRIWREFESRERIEAWLGLGHTLVVYEPGAEGEAWFSVEIGGEGARFGGPIVAFEPGRELSLEINWLGDRAWPVPTFWTFRLSPLYGGTLVEIFHHGFERLGSAAADQLQGYEEGWDVKHLKALRRVVEG